MTGAILLLQCHHLTGAVSLPMCQLLLPSAQAASYTIPHQCLITIQLVGEHLVESMEIKSRAD